MSPIATPDLRIVRQRLSPERLRPYELAAGDLASAMTLYEWNVDASAAFYGLLHGVEVILRNAIHDQMTGWHAGLGLTGIWFDDPSNILEPRLHGHIDGARQRVLGMGRQVTPGRLVSELTFGFWRYLLAARYEQALWTPALRHAFPHLRPQRRAYVAQRVERLHHLRNRVAHYEPVHLRRLELDHRDALEVVAAISPDSRDWLAATSLVPGTLSARPLSMPLP